MTQDVDPNEPGRWRDIAGLVGWGLLLAIAAAMLIARFTSGGC